MRAGHPLYSLQGRSLGRHALVVLVGPSDQVDAHDFQIRLQDRHGNLSLGYVLSGMHNRGTHPPKNWIEVMAIDLHIAFVDYEVKLNEEQEMSLFQDLAELIPPGGQMVVEYDSPSRKETALALAQGVPPILTPLGRIMYLAGCGAGFKDWHISEGWSEGPRKLQGYKAIDDDYSKEKQSELTKGILSFLIKADLERGSPLAERARDLLKRLTRGRPELAREVEYTLRGLR